VRQLLTLGVHCRARQIATESCRLCRRPIGFDRFYSKPDEKVHAACLEAEVTKKLKAGLPRTEVKFLTVEEAAELLRVEPETIRNWVSQNRIPFRKAGAKTLFLLEELIEWTVPANRKQSRARLSAAR
jgi:excisionase family DNA binding protein